jgi:hypothetical protein
MYIINWWRYLLVLTADWAYLDHVAWNDMMVGAWKIKKKMEKAVMA